MADAAWWIPLASGALGVAGALSGTWLTQRNSTARETVQWQRLVRRQDDEWRRQRADKTRDLHFQLYLDIMEYAEDRDRLIVHVENGARGQYKPTPDLQSESRLQARVLLYAEEQLRDRWVSAWQAIEAIETVVAEEDGFPSQPDRAELSRARVAIEDLQDELRRLVTAEDAPAESGVRE